MFDFKIRTCKKLEKIRLTSSFTPCITGSSVHREMFSTSGGVQHIGGYHEYIGGCSVHRGYHNECGGYHEYIGGIP